MASKQDTGRAPSDVDADADSVAILHHAYGVEWCPAAAMHAS